MPLESISAETPLLNQIQALRSTVATCIEELPDDRYRLVLEQMLRLGDLADELHRLQLLKVLAHLQRNNREVDDELKEICDYVEQILAIHRCEAENLGKML